MLWPIIVLMLSAGGSTVRPDSSPAGAHKLLFLDAAAISQSANVSLRMAQPWKGRIVVAADRPWESFGVADSTLHALQLGDGAVRLYYGCAERLPGGTALAPKNIRRVCVAESTDGVTFVKPSLGLYTWNGSTANNIIAITPTQPLCGAKPYQPCSAVSAARECVLGSVWLDSRPGVSHAARYKMACAVEPNDNTYMFSSEDGLNFTRMFDGPSINGSDTPVTCMHDNTLGRYVCYVRADYFNSFGKDARSLLASGLHSSKNASNNRADRPRDRAVHRGNPGRLHHGNLRVRVRERLRGRVSC